MKKSLLLIAILIPSIFYAQETKQYSGDFYDGTTQQGKATYSYYLKNDERIKHGSFSYTRNLKSDEGSYSASVTGNFKNNFKDGSWTQTLNFKDWDNGTENYVTGTISLTSNYNNGLPNGQWIYSENSKSRIKKINVNGYVWSTFTEPTSSKAIINFKNGLLNGNFLMENFILNSWDNIKATFDEKGFCIKNLTLSALREETSIDYYKNTIIKEVRRNKSTGEVIEKSDYSPQEVVILQKYSDGQISSSELANNHLRVDTAKWLTLDNFKTNFYRSEFLDEYLKGDKVYDENFDFGGYHLYTTKYKLTKLSEIEKLKWAENDMSDKNFESALTKLENIKGEYGNNLSSDDLAKLNAKISECKNLFERTKSDENKKKEKVNEWWEIENFSVREAKISQVRDILKKVKSFEERYKDNLTNTDKEKIKFQTDRFNSEIKTKISNQQVEVENLYLVRDAGFNIKSINKKNLYNAYEIAKKDLEEKRKSFANDMQMVIDTENILIKLYDKMISLANQNTDELEKSLKKEKDAQKILNILGI